MPTPEPTCKSSAWENLQFTTPMNHPAARGGATATAHRRIIANTIARVGHLPRRSERRRGFADFTFRLASHHGGSNEGYQGQHDERLHSRVSFALRALKMVGLATDACNVRGRKISCQL